MCAERSSGGRGIQPLVGRQYASRTTRVVDATTEKAWALSVELKACLEFCDALFCHAIPPSLMACGGVALCVFFPQEDQRPPVVACAPADTDFLRRSQEVRVRQTLIAPLEMVGLLEPYIGEDLVFARTW
jgi:hypothetical protein